MNDAMPEFGVEAGLDLYYAFYGGGVGVGGLLCFVPSGTERGIIFIINDIICKKEEFLGLLY